MSNKININLNKDDTSTNDYLFCVSEFGEIPNKISIYSIYNVKLFNEYVNKVSKSQISAKEIIPTGEDHIINEKHLIKIDDYYLSFIEYDRESDLGVITDIIIYYLNDSKNKVDEFVKAIDEFVVDYQDDTTEHRFNILTTSADGLQLEPIDMLEADYDNIDLYYENSVMKKANKLAKLIKKSNKGLSIIYGERGVGKTTLLNHVVLGIDKLCIFVPSNMVDITINSNDFKNLIKRYRNSILIIDDCEIFFSHTYTKSNILTNNLLQMVDGVSSDMDNLHIVAILNTENINDIDPVLLECNNIVDVIEVGRLKNDKSKKLCEHLNQKNKFKDPRLVDIIRGRKGSGSMIEMGF